MTDKPTKFPYSVNQVQDDSEIQKFIGLDLRSHHLITLSPALFSYTFITTLYLDYNALKEIPREILSLKNLTMLSISNNRLKKVPSFIFKLCNLRSLDLSNNYLTELPNELGSLNLISLKLEGNPLVEPYSGNFLENGWVGVMDWLRDAHFEYNEPEDRVWVYFKSICLYEINCDDINALSYKGDVGEIDPINFKLEKDADEQSSSELLGSGNMNYNRRISLKPLKCTSKDKYNFNRYTGKDKMELNVLLNNSGNYFTTINNLLSRKYNSSCHLDNINGNTVDNNVCNILNLSNKKDQKALKYNTANNFNSTKNLKNKDYTRNNNGNCSNFTNNDTTSYNLKNKDYGSIYNYNNIKYLNANTIASNFKNKDYDAINNYNNTNHSNVNTVSIDFKNKDNDTINNYSNIKYLNANTIASNFRNKDYDAINNYNNMNYTYYDNDYNYKSKNHDILNYNNSNNNSTNNNYSSRNHDTTNSSSVYYGTNDNYNTKDYNTTNSNSMQYNTNNNDFKSKNGVLKDVTIDISKKSDFTIYSDKYYSDMEEYCRNIKSEDSNEVKDNKNISIHKKNTNYTSNFTKYHRKNEITQKEKSDSSKNIVDYNGMDLYDKNLRAFNETDKIGDLLSNISIDQNINKLIGYDTLNENNRSDIDYLYSNPQNDINYIPLYLNEEFVFSIGSYNILSETYATQTHFYYVPSWALDWNYRREKITAEIVNANFDIFCMQELETNEYSTYFRNNLHEKMNYESTFYPKTRSKTMGYNAGTVDGCATFWKKNKFTLIEQRFVEFSTIFTSDTKWEENHEVWSRNKTKDNIALITVIEKKDNYIFRNKIKIENKSQNNNRKKCILIIINTHLTWDPQYKDVKLTQTIILKEEIKKIKEKYIDAGIFLAGDFNSTHDSGVYEYITTGILTKNHRDFMDFDYQTYTKNGLESGFKLNDTYKYNKIKEKCIFTKDKHGNINNVNKSEDESKINTLKYTNKTATFEGIIDYIFYSDNIERIAYLGKINEKYFDNIAGLPSVHLPSDHIKIGGKYLFSKNKKYHR